MHKKAAAVVRQWADVVGYCTHTYGVKKTDKGFGQKSTRAVKTGNRVMRLQPEPSFYAKNRYNMPDEIDLNWEAFASALAESNKQRKVK